jgi:hypothetical protein
MAAEYAAQEFRRIAFDVAPLYVDLRVRAAAAQAAGRPGQAKWAETVLAYSRAVRETLASQKAAFETGEVEAPDDAVAVLVQHVIWHLLEALFLQAPASPTGAPAAAAAAAAAAAVAVIPQLLQALRAARQPSGVQEASDRRSSGGKRLRGAHRRRVRPPTPRDGPRAGAVAPLLVEWLAANAGIIEGGAVYVFDSLAATAAQLSALDFPGADERYWPTVTRLAALGRTREARELLEFHEAAKAGRGGPFAAAYEIVDALALLLRRRPRLASPGAAEGGGGGVDAAGGPTYDSVPEFDAAFRQFQAAAADALRAKAAGLERLKPAARDGARALLAVLCGDDAALAGAVDSWLELTVALLAHRFPSARAAAAVEPLMRQARRAKPPAMSAAGGGAEENPILGLLAALLPPAAGLEAVPVLHAATHAAPMVLPWTLAHIGDLLAPCARDGAALRETVPSAGCAAAEAYALAYADRLARGRSTWRVAAEYYAWCPVKGAARLEALLSSSAWVVEDEGAGRAALALCARHSLPALERTLCGKFGRAAEAAGHLEAALTWFLRAGDDAALRRALRPRLAAVEAALLAPQGAYEGRELTVAGLEELEPLMRLSGGAGPHTGGGARPAGDAGDASSSGGGSARHRPLRFLGAFRELQLAVREVREASSSSSSPSPAAAADGDGGGGAALRRAHARARDALLPLVAGGLAPAPLRVPLLFHCLPLLEAQASALSADDVAALLRAVGEVAESHAAPLALAALPPRCLADVRLALARGLARAHAAGGAGRAAAAY